MGYFDFEFPHTRFYESDLREILKYVKNLIDAVKKIDGWIETHEKEYEELKGFQDALIKGDFPPEMENALYEWTVKHTEEIVGKTIKMVFFGITDDGYFVAHIPESWDEIIFNTAGLDIVIPDVKYGTLVLSY